MSVRPQHGDTQGHFWQTLTTAKCRFDHSMATHRVTHIFDIFSRIVGVVVFFTNMLRLRLLEQYVFLIETSVLVVFFACVLRLRLLEQYVFLLETSVLVVFFACVLRLRLLEQYVFLLETSVLVAFFTNVLRLRLLEQYVFFARDLGCCCLFH